jgi:hypothetical protein
VCAHRFGEALNAQPPTGPVGCGHFGVKFVAAAGARPKPRRGGDVHPHRDGSVGWARPRHSLRCGAILASAVRIGGTGFVVRAGVGGVAGGLVVRAAAPFKIRRHDRHRLPVGRC